MDLFDLIIVQRGDVIGLQVSLDLSLFGNLLRQLTPDLSEVSVMQAVKSGEVGATNMLSILSEVVTLCAPSGFLTTCSSVFSEEEVQL